MGLWVGAGSTTLAGDVTGPANANTLVQITGSGGVVQSSAAIAFGALATAAQSGNIRAQNATVIAAARGVAGVTDITALASGANDRIHVGAKSDGTVSSTGVSLWATGGWELQWSPGALVSAAGSLSIGTNVAGRTVTLQSGAATTNLVLSDSLSSALLPLAFTARTSAAATGDIRGPKDFTIKARNAGNTVDATIAFVDGANNLGLGDGTNFASTTVRASSEVDILATSVIAIETSSAFIDGSSISLRDVGHVATLLLSLSSAGASSAQWAAGTTPAITHAQSTVASTVDFTISAQAAKAASGANGGNLILSGGTPDGAGTNGRVKLRSNATDYLQIGASGAEFGSTAVAIAAGTNTLTATQFAFPLIRLTGNLVGGAATVVLPNQAGTWWFDISQLTGTTGVNFKSGTTTSATLTTPAGTSAQIVQVCCFGGNTVVVNV